VLPPVPLAPVSPGDRSEVFAAARSVDRFWERIWLYLCCRRHLINLEPTHLTFRGLKRDDCIVRLLLQKCFSGFSFDTPRQNRKCAFYVK